MPPRTGSFRFGLDVLAALAVLGVLVRAAVRSAHLQWDFRVYLEAAHAARAGLDPYVLENLHAVSGKPALLPFLYPPAALLPFLALSTLPESAALALWAGFKVALASFLVVLWKRVFLPGAPWSVLALVAVFGANAAALWDVRSGNVGLVEAALVWAGLAGFVRGRPTLFATLVVLAATFKLAPAAFLLLLLVPVDGGRPRPGLFALALAAVVAIAFLPVHVGPAAHWHNVLHVVPGALPAGEANPSVLAFLAERLRAPGGPALSPLALALWAGYAIALLAVSARGLRSLDACGLALASVGLFLLLSPRPMAYGWVIGGGTLVALVRRAVPGEPARAALTVLVVFQGALWAAWNPLSGALAAQLPWVVLLLLWLLARFAQAPGRMQEEPLPARVS